ncbi:MAG TPA: hypothetical protein VEP72_03710 [Microbacterium sp.]|nr:hypothetical protein [Microbacterium sp.]
MTDTLPRLDGAFDGSDARTLNRRQLIRAGAWAAPVIVLATAAPAAAVSPDKATVHMYNFSQNGKTVHWSASQNANVVDALKGSVSFKSDASSAQTVTSATLTVTVIGAAGLRVEKPVITAGASNWSVVSSTKSGDSMVYVFLFAGSVAAGATSPTLSYTLLADGLLTVSQFGARTAQGLLTSSQIVTTSAETSWGAW